MLKRMAMIWLFVVVSVLSAVAQRQHVSVDGRWEFVKVKSLDELPSVQGWQPIQVPGTVYGYNYERAWFRRKFFVPEEWRNHRLILHFGGVKYNSRIYLARISHAV